jgi:hypothetical protein
MINDVSICSFNNAVLIMSIGDGKGEVDALRSSQALELFIYCGRMSWTEACAPSKSGLVVAEFCSHIEIIILDLGTSIHHLAA